MDEKYRILRVDERDIVFARQDLFRFFGAGSRQFKSFYREHPEWLAFDQAISEKTPLGGLNPLDSPMFQGQFAILDYLGREEVVSGEAFPEKIIFVIDDNKIGG